MLLDIFEERNRGVGFARAEESEAVVQLFAIGGGRKVQSLLELGNGFGGGGGVFVKRFAEVAALLQAFGNVGGCSITGDGGAEGDHECGGGDQGRLLRPQGPSCLGFQHSFRMARTASTHNAAACFDSLERPPTAASTVSRVISARAARSHPSIKTVNADPLAIDAAQPRTLYPTSATRPDSMRTESRRISPQTGFETSTVIAGGGNSPTLRGLRKWSISSGLTANHKCRLWDNKRMTTVVAGILARGDTILICRRRADQPHALKWEFPGGKVEPGESPVAALQRELQEELGIDSEPATEITRYEFTYPGKNPILLIFLRVAEWRGEVVNRIFEAVVWEQAGRLRDYDFLEGDVLFLESGVLGT